MALVMSKIVTTNTFEIVFNHIHFTAIVLCSWTHLKHNNIHKHTHTVIHTQNILIFLFLMFESSVRIVLKICLERQVSFLSLANVKWPKLITEPAFNVMQWPGQVAFPSRISWYSSQTNIYHSLTVELDFAIPDAITIGLASYAIDASNKSLAEVLIWINSVNPQCSQIQ